MVEIKDFELDVYLDIETKPKKGNDREKNIIDAEPNATVSTSNIHKEEPEDSEEEEHIFTPRCG